MSTLVRPQSPMSLEAQAVHGLKEEDLKRAPPLAEAVDRLEGLVPPDEVVLCGHNISFDVSFLKSAYDRLNRKYPYDYHTVDLWSVAYFLFSADGLKPTDLRLNTLASLYSLRRGRRHDALEDVRVTAKILRYLYRVAVESDIKLSGQGRLFPTAIDP